LDKYEELIQKFPKMSEADKKKLDQTDRSECNCPPCPTHLQCAKDRGELLFCFEGKSGCIKERKVCYCPDCPVHDKYDLKFMYYCLRGTEADQRGNRGKK
jgi:Protein of unknown function (DUF2769)